MFQSAAPPRKLRGFWVQVINKIMIETAFDRIRKQREESVKQLWETHYKPGAKKTPIAQAIAEQLEISLSTVNRILKQLNLPE